MRITIQRDAFFARRFLIVLDGWRIIDGFDKLFDAFEAYPDAYYDEDYCIVE